MPDYEKPKASVHTTKKCPFCYVYAPLTATECPACKRRIGKIDKIGFATKPVDWKAYFIAALSFAVLAAWIWWAFLSE